MGAERVAGGRTALDPMVRHDGVYDVLRAALRHVAADAIGFGRVLARLHGLAELGGVALAAHGVVVSEASAPRGMSCGLWQVVQVSFPLVRRKHCDLRKR